MSNTQRRWLSATFWLDVLERTVRTFIGAVLGVLGATTEWPNEWGELAWKTIILTTLATFLIALAAGFVGEPGTASVMNPAPPDTLRDAGFLKLPAWHPRRDRGLSAVEIVIIVAIVLAVLFVLANV